ncbi:MAG: cytoplasmic protein [Syntrophales bacterium]|nr:cytoplasmic protein [Syntrophales bacterium]
MRRSSFNDFDATELYCPRCRRAVQVRKRLLLVLPQGDKYDYRCAFCGFSVGEKQESVGEGAKIIFGG